ncbi:unnamed protein product [Discosporangium mesarthrocarpum]
MWGKDEDPETGMVLDDTGRRNIARYDHIENNQRELPSLIPRHDAEADRVVPALGRGKEDGSYTGSKRTGISSPRAISRGTPGARELPGRKEGGVRRPSRTSKLALDSRGENLPSGESRGTRNRSESDLCLHTTRKDMSIQDQVNMWKPNVNLKHARGFFRKEEEDKDKAIAVGRIKPVNMQKEIKSVSKVLLLVLVALAVAEIVRWQMPKLKIRPPYWGILAAVILVSAPLLRFTFRVFAYTLTNSLWGLLYYGNGFYFPVVLHKEIALVLHGILVVAFWRGSFKRDYLDWERESFNKFDQVFTNVLESYLAYRVGLLLKDVIVLVLATTYLWKPYLERVKSTILAQYIVLLLKDYCLKGSFNPDDEEFAIQMSKQGSQLENLSLYAMSKAMDFLPRNKIGDLFIKELRGLEDTHSSDAATDLGSYLFKELSIRAAERAAKFEEKGDAPIGPEMGLKAKGHREHGMRDTGKIMGVLSEGVSKVTGMHIAEAMRATEGKGSRAEGLKGSRGSKPGSAGGGEGGKAEHEVEGREDVDDDLSKAIYSSEEKAEGEREEEELLRREELCPGMDPSLLNVAFNLFDMDNTGSISKNEMIGGVDRTLKDQSNLALTLEDSENITRKLGQIVLSLIFFLLLFVWLSIWGEDVVALGVTFASSLIAISFMIGPAASNLVSSIIFIFVMRIFDVGDRIFIYSDRPGEEPMNLKVVKINILTTVLKRADEQLFYIPNQKLATKTIVNVQRSAHQWHEFRIHVSVSTPSEKLAALHRFLIRFAKKNDTRGGLYPYIMFSLLGIEDSNRLGIRVTFRQKSNWQAMDKKLVAQTLCILGIKKACEELDISYTMTPLPVYVTYEESNH